MSKATRMQRAATEIGKEIDDACNKLDKQPGYRLDAHFPSDADLTTIIAKHFKPEELAEALLARGTGLLIQRSLGGNSKSRHDLLTATISAWMNEEV